MSSPLRRCSLKGKAVATGSDSESSGSPLIRRPRTIMLGGMDDPRPTTTDLALLDDSEHDIVMYSIELEDREASGHAPADDVEQDVEPESDRSVTPSADIDSSNKDKSSAEKISFALADFLPMRWTGTDFEFDEEIDLEQEHTLSVKKNQNWVNQLSTKPWTPPAGYATVYESWFTNCSLWWPLPEFLTTYCHRRKIALGQYTANGIRIMVTLTVLAAELGITMSVRLFEELTTPSITGRTGFFYGKMVPKYNVITGKPLKVNFWNHRYFYVKINEASFEDPSIVLNGYFNANIGRPAKRKRDSSVRDAPLHISPNRSPSVGPEEYFGDEQGEKDPPAAGEPSIVPVGEAEASVPTAMPIEEHPVEETRTVEGLQGDQSQGPASAIQSGEIVKYPHAIDFNYRSIDVPFIEDHEAPARMFCQIKLKKRGMPELDQLHQDSRYREMSRAGGIFFGNTNLMVRDYEVKLRAQETSLEAKTKSLKKKRKEVAELAYKCSSYERQVEGLTVEKNEALEKAELERSRNELLSTELAALKAEKELLNTRCYDLEKEKSELSMNFEATTRRLRESREHEVKKERLRVESILRQKVVPTYERMGQFLEEQPEIQSKLALYSQAKGTREGLEKIQTQGLSMEEVLQKARTDEAHFLEELQSMEIVDASEIDLLPVDLDEYGSNMAVFSLEDIQDLRA
ncbi:hypothetical protein N665_0125s0004 [Sinapis alba]|nr:hypothetical protein N665_0125s0004 [Sinapis alba]